MNFYYLPSGYDAFCIVDENDNLILNYANIYEKLNIKNEGRKNWVYSQIYRDTESFLPDLEAAKAFNKWKEENINNIPYSPKQLKKLEEPEEIDVPF